MTDEQKAKSQRELDEYLAKIRRTVSESNALIQSVELRLQETDNLLASQGLTREQVAAMRFTPEQLEKVNEELKRRGLPPLEDEPMEDGYSSQEDRAAALMNERLWIKRLRD